LEADDVQLVLRGEHPPAGPLGHLRIRALLLAGHPSSIAGHRRTVEHGHGHQKVSIPALGESVVTERAGASRQLGREGRGHAAAAHPCGRGDGADGPAGAARPYDLNVLVACELDCR